MQTIIKGLKAIWSRIRPVSYHKYEKVNHISERIDKVDSKIDKLTDNVCRESKEIRDLIISLIGGK